MITIFAPDGIGEVAGGTDLAALVADAVAADPAGPLADGDVVVVTSKIVSKAEGRRFAAEDKPALLRAETARTVARRGVGFAIVATRHGLVQAAAGIDASNVATGEILGLPLDPDASAERLRAGLVERTGRRVGVIVSDTSGRAWRTGQTDHAIGVAGVVTLLDYGGRTDPYGNPLRVTAMAVADELAAAADLAKAKLRGRPVAVVRGVAELLAPGGRLRDLVRPIADDLFRLGSRESVIDAVARAADRADLATGPAAEELYRAEPDELVAALTAGLDPVAASFAERMLRYACERVYEGEDSETDRLTR